MQAEPAETKRAAGHSASAAESGVVATRSAAERVVTKAVPSGMAKGQPERECRHGRDLARARVRARVRKRAYADAEAGLANSARGYPGSVFRTRVASKRCVRAAPAAVGCSCAARADSVQRSGVRTARTTSKGRRPKAVLARWPLQTSRACPNTRSSCTVLPAGVPPALRNVHPSTCSTAAAKHTFSRVLPGQ